MDVSLLRDVVEELAPIARLPTSPGEREAAHRIAVRMQEVGCTVAVHDEPAFSSYAWPVGLLSAVGVGSAVLAGRGRRAVGAVGGALVALGIVDDISGGRRFARLLLRPRQTVNVVGTTGDQRAAHTLCVTVHHDAAPSGYVFEPGLQEWVADRFPGVIARMKTNPPLWWPVVAGPAMVSAGSLLGRRWLRNIGMALSAGSLAAMVDIGRRPSVPGANDNLSGVAAALAVAVLIRERPIEGLRILLVSAGAEEALQEGIRAFMRRYASLRQDRTWFLNVDTVGSGRLVLLEGEGPVRMRSYDRRFNDLIATCADAEDIPLWRGLRSRNSTDGSVPNKLGYPAASLVSVDDRKLLPHYHLDSDLPEHVDYDCVASAVRLIDSVARALSRERG
jgi:hypothetical protein